MAASIPAADKPLRIALLGAGEVAQVIHLPVLLHLQPLYTVVAVADVSPVLASQVAKKYNIPHHTTDVPSLISNPDVDVIFNLTSDAYHAHYTVAALAAGKHVFLEKPFTLSLAAGQRILDAERSAPNGARVFVGYMRRYAGSFTSAFKREVASIPKILYARSRDFSGPNPYFVAGSGAFPFPLKVEDISEQAKTENQGLLDGLLSEATGFPEGKVPKEVNDYVRFMNTLGSHDISLMRETLGEPMGVDGVSVNHPFYSAIFRFKEGFSCTYESGLDGVPVFDAHLAIYGEKKRVSIEYDSPFVKGLAIKVRVDEVNEEGDIQSREMLSSYEDAFTVELKEVYECFAKGKQIKTTAEDAMGELRIFDMMYKKHLAEASKSS